MKKFILPVFILVILVQWYVPGKMVWDREMVIKKGKAFRFETEPIDPNNPFKGKYIWLNFKENNYNVTGNTGFYDDDEVYVSLTTGKDGFAKIERVSAVKPAGATNYVKATVNYNSKLHNVTTVHLTYPFNEFYMDEYKAPKAETIYRESAIDSTKKTYAVVKVWEGEAVLENVFIDDIPISQMIDKQ